MKKIIIFLVLSLALVSCNKMLNDKAKARVSEPRWVTQPVYTHRGYIKPTGDTVIVNTTKPYCVTDYGDTVRTMLFFEYGIATTTYDITNTGITEISKYVVIIDLLLENGSHMSAKTEGYSLSQTDHNTIEIDTKGKRVIDMKISDFVVQ